MSCIRIRLAAALQALWLLAAAPLALGADVVRDIPFSSPGAPGNALALDLYVPEQGAPSANTTIIMIHGGSYNSGCRCDFDALSTALANLGFTVVSPDYTLVTPTSASYPQPISDIFNALHWVRTEGEAIGLPNKVIVCGVSAGSTIGMTAALAASTNVFSRLPDPPNRGYTVDGAIGVMGRYDLVWNANFGVPQTVMSYIGVPFSNPNWGQTWSQASAIAYANANSPPTFLIHGTSDGLVPYFNSTRLHQRLIDVGASVQLALIPGLGHDMSILGYTSQQQAQTIAAAVAWIDSGIAPPAPGSCCAPTGSCSTSTQASCQWIFTSGGSCSPNLCQQPPLIGACCLSSGACVLIDRNLCQDQWNGVVSCAPNPCPPPPPPLGACCAQSGLCSFTPQSFCQSDWTANVFCQPNPCQQPPPPPPPLGACCDPSGACAPTIGADCGMVWIYGASCSPNPCLQPPPPAGACCMGATCAIALQSDCTGPNRRFTGNQTTCNVAASTTPCCRADFNHNDTVAVSDIFDYLTSWFDSSHDCCITSPPNAAPGIQDIFEFLNAWFAGC